MNYRYTITTTATLWTLDRCDPLAFDHDHGYLLRPRLLPPALTCLILGLGQLLLRERPVIVLQWKCYDYNDKMFKDLELDFARTTCDPLLLALLLLPGLLLLCQSLLPLPPLATTTNSGTTIITTTTTTTGLPSPSPPLSPSAPTSIRSLSTTWQISLIPANHFYEFFFFFNFLALG